MNKHQESFRIKSLIGEEATCWLISPYRLSVFWESGVHEFWSPKDMEDMIAHYGWEELEDSTQQITRIKECSANAYTASLWQISDHFYTLQWDHWVQSITYCKEDVEDNFTKGIWTKVEDNASESLPRSFKFKTSGCSEHDIIIYTYKETQGSNNIFWGANDVESIHYNVDSIRRLIAAGDWIVLPSEPEKKSDEDFTRQCIDKLNTYTGCMSYNDSYFGEPEGELKRVIRELDKTYNKSKEKIVDTLQLKVEIDGIKETQAILADMVKHSNTTLEAIKSFTTGTGHDVFISEGVYKVYRKGEDEPYICHSDTILIEVMEALVTLDEVGKE